MQIVDGIPATVGVRMLTDLAGVLPDERDVPLLDGTICSRVASRARAHDRAVELRPGRPRLQRLIVLTGPDAEGVFRSWLKRTGSGLITAAGSPTAT